MSLKAELETWAAALKAYDEQDFEKALDLFSRIADSSKILTNIGLIYATLGEHEAAVERFTEATGLDQYLAVAYFQRGVSNFLLGRYDVACQDFDEALLYLRGNQAINYEQLGLKFRLFSAEVLFNRGLSLIYMDRVQDGMSDMQEAQRNKATDEHNVIDDAIRDKGEGYTVFSIPVGVLYRPSEKKLKNAVQKDYMGKAKLVAASDPGDMFTTFTGVTRLKQGISPSGTFLDRPDDVSGASLVRSATVPPVMPPADPVLGPRSAGLERAKTTINVTTARNGGPNPQSLRSPGSGPSMARSNTILNNVRPPPSAAIGTPVRGLSVRRPGDSSPANPQGPPTKDTRMTDFYDDYLDSYTDEPVPPINSAPLSRAPTWARNNMGGAYPPMRSQSRSTPNSQYAPSSYSAGGTVRRKTTRRVPNRAPSRIRSTYEEEEEGYGSGEYDDGPYEFVKIRVKLHYQDDVRGMALDPLTPFGEFMEKLTGKFGTSINGLALKFKDEEGGKVTLQDESDYELAIETARESSKGKPEGKLEIWCTDV